MNAGSEFITKDGAELMMSRMLEEYETTKVEPRHRETQKDLKEIQKSQGILMELANRGRGIKDFLKEIPVVVSMVWLIIQIFHGTSR